MREPYARALIPSADEPYPGSLESGPRSGDVLIAKFVPARSVPATSRDQTG
jgi:hypothetical protein